MRIETVFKDHRFKTSLVGRSCACEDRREAEKGVSSDSSIFMGDAIHPQAIENP